MSAPASCAGCRFAAKIATRESLSRPLIGEYTLQCRRSPPTAVVVQQAGATLVTGIFPPVDGSMVCEEFRPADESPAPDLRAVPDPAKLDG